MDRLGCRQRLVLAPAIPALLYSHVGRIRTESGGVASLTDSDDCKAEYKQALTTEAHAMEFIATRKLCTDALRQGRNKGPVLSQNLGRPDRPP